MVSPLLKRRAEAEGERRSGGGGGDAVVLAIVRRMRGKARRPLFVADDKIDPEI